MTSKHWIIGFIGISFIVLSSLDWLQEYSDKNSPVIDADNSLPEYSMRNASITQYNDLGVKQYTIDAQQYQYFINTKVGKLTNPVIIMHTNKGAKWRISSQQGEIYPASGKQQETIELQQQVVVEQLIGMPLNLYTEHLTLYPEQEFATTQDDVMIEQRNSNTHGQGMQAKFAQEHILLGTVANSRGKTSITAKNKGESRWNAIFTKRWLRAYY